MSDLKGPCIEFEGGHDSWGYGVVSQGTTLVGAHRVEWAKRKGEIPDGLHVLHKCDNPGCINIDHLFLGTHQDNMKDRDAKGRQHSGLTRLTEDEVRKIKHLLTTTRRTLEDIGNEFYVTKYAIWDIKHGRTWTHV
jgi:hypothetical protein